MHAEASASPSDRSRARGASANDLSPILVVPYMWIGDFVRCHSVVQLLRTRFPERPVDMLSTTLCAPLADYMPRLGILPLAGARVSEVDLVGMHSQDESTRNRRPRPPTGAFRVSGLAVTDTYTIVRYRSAAPVQVGYRQLLPVALGDPPAAVAVQSP